MSAPNDYFTLSDNEDCAFPGSLQTAVTARMPSVLPNGTWRGNSKADTEVAEAAHLNTEYANTKRRKRLTNQCRIPEGELWFLQTRVACHWLTCPGISL
jgi:hypothetical protein